MTLHIKLQKINTMDNIINLKLKPGNNNGAFISRNNAVNKLSAKFEFVRKTDNI